MSKPIQITVERDGDDAIYVACAHEGLPGLWVGHGETVAGALRSLAETIEELPKMKVKARPVKTKRVAKESP